MKISKTRFTTDLYDYMRGIGATNPDGSLVTGTYLGVPCQSELFGSFNNCFLPERLFGVMTNELMGTFLADDTLFGESSQTTIDVLLLESLKHLIDLLALLLLMSNKNKIIN